MLNEEEKEFLQFLQQYSTEPQVEEKKEEPEDDFLKFLQEKTTQVPQKEEPKTVEEDFKSFLEERIKQGGEPITEEIEQPAEEPIATTEKKKTLYDILDTLYSITSPGMPSPSGRQYEVGYIAGLPTPVGQYITPSGEVGYNPVMGSWAVIKDRLLSGYTLGIPKLISESLAKIFHTDSGYTVEPLTKAEEIAGGVAGLVATIKTPFFPKLAEGVHKAVSKILPERVVDVGMAKIYGKGKFLNRLGTTAAAYGLGVLEEGTTLGLTFALQAPVSDTLGEDLQNRFKSFLEGYKVAGLYKAIGALNPKLLTFLAGSKEARILSYFTENKTPLLFNILKAGAAATYEFLHLDEATLLDKIFHAGVSAYFGFNSQFMPQAYTLRSLKTQIESELKEVKNKDKEVAERLDTALKDVSDTLTTTSQDLPPATWEKVLESMKLAKNPLERLKTLSYYIEAADRLRGKKLPKSEIQVIKKFLNEAYGDLNKLRSSKKGGKKAEAEDFFIDIYTKRVEDGVLLLNHFENPETTPYPEKDAYGEIIHPERGSKKWLQKQLKRGSLIKTAKGFIIERTPHLFFPEQTNFERFFKPTKVGEFIGDSPEEKSLYWTDTRVANELGSPKRVPLSIDFKKRANKVAKEVAKIHNAEGSSLYNVYLGNLGAEDLHIVNLYPERTLVIKDRLLTKEDVIDFINRNADLLSNPFATIRTTKEGNTTKFEVVATFKDEATATKYANQIGQKIQERAFSTEKDIIAYHFSDKLKEPYAWLSPQAERGYVPADQTTLPKITFFAQGSNVDLTKFGGRNVYEVRLSSEGLYKWDGVGDKPTPQEVVFKYNKAGILNPDGTIELYTPIGARRVAKQFKPATEISSYSYEQLAKELQERPEPLGERPIDEVVELLNSYPAEQRVRAILEGHLHRCPKCKGITLSDADTVICSHCGADLTNQAKIARELLSNLKVDNLNQLIESYKNAYNFDNPEDVRELLRDIGIAISTTPASYKRIKDLGDGAVAYIRLEKNKRPRVVIDGIKPAKDIKFEELIEELPDDTIVAALGDPEQGATVLTAGQLKPVLKMKDIRKNVYLKPGIHLFEEELAPFKELFYMKARYGEDFWTKEKVRAKNLVKEFKKQGFTKQDDRDLAIYALWQQEDLRPTLQEMGITAPPRLSPIAQKVYDTIVKNEYPRYLQMLNEARAKLGLDPIEGIENYAPAIRNIAENGDTDFLLNKNTKQINSAIRTPYTPFLKERVPNKIELKLEFLSTYEKYVDKMAAYIGKADAVAMGRLFYNPIRVEVGDKVYNWSLKEQLPGVYKELFQWHEFAILKSGTPEPIKYLENVPKISKFLWTVRKNVGAAILAWNARSALIQFSAIRNAQSELGLRDLAVGLYNFFTKNSRFIYENSRHIASRRLDIDMKLEQVEKAEKWWDKPFEYLGKIQYGLTKYGMLPLQIMDLWTSEVVWWSAYNKGKRLGLTGRKLFDYADDVVVRTQASASPHDIAKIQRISEMRFFTLFQTFTINEWNMLRRMFGQLKHPTPKAVYDVGRFLFIAALWNYLFDELHIQSPFPDPIGAAKKTWSKTGDYVETAIAVAKELVEQFPILGSVARYTTEYRVAMPAALGAIYDSLIAMNKIINTREFAPLRLEDWSALAKLAGVPGAAEFEKVWRRRNAGASWIESILGIDMDYILEGGGSESKELQPQFRSLAEYAK